MKRIVLIFALAMSVAAGSASAATIDVLWYQGGGDAGFANEYQTAIDGLAALAPGAPGANTWNVTYWNAGAPPAGSFDVLVTMSPEGPWFGGSPDYTALNTAVTNSDVTYGNRIMVTGQDADWHYINSPGPFAFDGPQGFLLDAINWAGSGTGMGAVFLGTDSSVTSPGLSGFLYAGNFGDDIVIPGAYAAAPINTGLTSAGLSNWSTSAHQTYLITDASQWVAINTLGVEGDAITIISAEEAEGDITPVPEPLTLSMLGLGMVGMYRARRRTA